MVTADREYYDSNALVDSRCFFFFFSSGCLLTTHARAMNNLTKISLFQIQLANKMSAGFLSLPFCLILFL